LEGCEDAIDANYVDFAPRTDDFLVDRVRAESGVCVGQRSDDLHARHRNAISGGAQLSKGVILVGFCFVDGCNGCHVSSILGPSLFHGDIVLDAGFLWCNTPS